MTASPRSPSLSPAPNGMARASLASGTKRIDRRWRLGHEGSRRPNGADNLRRSDSIRNNCPVGPQIPELPRRKTRNYGCKCGRISYRSRPPGTEFLDAETGRQKPPPKRVSAHRDQSPRSKWPEIPRNALFCVVSESCGLRRLDGGRTRAQTEDPPPSHRTGL